MTGFVVLAAPLLVGLGCWQLERAEQKQRFERAYLEGLRGLPVVPDEAFEDFQRLRLSGIFEPGRYFLVDNQVRRGEVGYTVVSSFRADDGRRWLINRGFLPGGMDRSRLPRVTDPPNAVTVIGVLWPELGLLPLLAEDVWPAGWPKRIQQLEVDRMARELNGAVAREIRLEAEQPGVLDPPLLTLNMPGARHTGYAVQWFALAAVLLVGYLLFGFRRT